MNSYLDSLPNLDVETQMYPFHEVFLIKLFSCGDAEILEWVRIITWFLTFHKVCIHISNR